MMDLFQESIPHAVMITGFVFMMMIVVEYLNVLTGGLWQQAFRGSRWRQYLLAGLLGATPGCLGAFTVVALYSHRVVSMGALVAAMIATSGDESFVMFAMIPAQALGITLILFVIGCLAGLLTDAVLGAKAVVPAGCTHDFEFHDIEECHCFSPSQIGTQWEHCTLARGTLTVVLALFVWGLLGNRIGPPVWNWIKITMLLVSAVALFIVVTVPDHFLEEHLWKHVARVHAPRIFFWTLGALILMHLLVERFRLTDWMQDNQLLMLAVAALVGLIPESGPHLVFLTLFTEKAIPFSILLASSIVQDGHGMLPLLAESRRDFIKVKAINLAAGLVIGLLGHALGL